MIFLIILLCALLCVFMCGRVRERLLNASILDNPNERSMHTAPVPRGGGIAIWLTVFPVWIIYDIAVGQFSAHFFVMLSVAALIVISWLDDKHTLPAAQRFAVHILAVICGLLSVPADHFVFQGILPLWLDRTMAGFAWLWFINLTNFMDGIDGITGAQTTHMGIGFILVSMIAGITTNDWIIAAAITGAAIGFLKWNWHPAKLFMGDVGSIPLGFILGYLMIILAIHGHLGIALTLPLYYIADATITLLRRILEKKKFWHAHREHFYQQAALGTQNPRPIVYAIIITNIGLFIIALASFRLGDGVFIAAPLLVAGLLWYLNRLSKKESPARAPL